MTYYKTLNKQKYTAGDYSIVPIRYIDRYDIMNWRNEQMYHLRQDEILTKEKQDAYFNSVISELFAKENPGQILFSYLEGDKCIGYGGLVHINWKDKHAEISFIMKTELETEFFEKHWKIYLGLIEEVAFKNLQLHKLHTYAFDLRPHLYQVLEAADFKVEAVLKEHCFFNENFYNVVIHSKFNN
jgi:RimJ/RimL family protein N-acetyltransferase